MQRKELIILLLILLFAFLLRTYNAGVPALNADEADTYDAAKEFIQQGTSPWDRWAGILPPVSVWTMSVFIKLLGATEWTIRLYGAVFGTLTVLTVYFLTKHHYGRNTAFLAASLAATLPLLVLSNRDAHPDNPLIFFSLASILLFEYARTTQKKWLDYTAGIFTAFSLLSKHNAVLFLALYWTFRYLTALNKKSFKQTTSHALRSATTCLATLFISFSFSFQNALYYGYGILYWTFNQSTGTNTPWYYTLSLLFDGLSPLLFILLPLAAIILIHQHNRNNNLHLFMCFLFLTIAILQGRKYPRHFLLALPFAAIIISNAAHALQPLLNKKQFTLLITILIISPTAWSAYKITDYQDYTVWKDIGSYILSTTNNTTTIYVDGIEYWTLRYYTQHQRTITSKTTTLHSGDILIIHALNNTTPYFIGSPLQNDLTLYTPEYAEQYKWNTDLYTFAQQNSIHLKTFTYDTHGNTIHIYKLAQQPPTHNNTNPPNFDKVTTTICNLWQPPTKQTLQKLLPKTIQEHITKKCTLGCVTTCEIF